jgi:hypothetical protein
MLWRLVFRALLSSLIFGVIYCSIAFATVLVLAVSFSAPDQQALVAVFAGMVFGPMVGALAGAIGLVTGFIYALVPGRARDWKVATALGVGVSIIANLLYGWESTAEMAVRQLMILLPFAGLASAISSFSAEKLLKRA